MLKVYVQLDLSDDVVNDFALGHELATPSDRLAASLERIRTNFFGLHMCGHARDTVRFWREL